MPGKRAVPPAERKQQVQSELRDLQSEIGTPEQRDALRRSNPKRYNQLMGKAKKLRAELDRLP